MGDEVGCGAESARSRLAAPATQEPRVSPRPHLAPRPGNAHASNLDQRQSRHSSPCWCPPPPTHTLPSFKAKRPPIAHSFAIACVVKSRCTTSIVCCQGAVVCLAGRYSCMAMGACSLTAWCSTLHHTTKGSSVFPVALRRLLARDGNEDAPRSTSQFVVRGWYQRGQGFPLHG